MRRSRVTLSMIETGAVGIDTLDGESFEDPQHGVHELRID